MDSLKKAKNFEKKHKPNARKSKLDKHEEAIKYLIDKEYTLLQIQEFLMEEMKLSVSYSNLQGWVKRRFNTKNHQANNQNKVTPVKDQKEITGKSSFDTMVDKHKKQEGE